MLKLIVNPSIVVYLITNLYKTKTNTLNTNIVYLASAIPFKHTPNTKMADEHNIYNLRLISFKKKI